MKLHMCLYLCAKFVVSSMIVTSFRQGGAAVMKPTQIKIKNVYKKISIQQ